MEIGDQSVQHLEAVAGIDEDAGPARRLLQSAVLGGKALHRPAGGSPHTDDPAAVPLGLIDGAGGLLWDHAVF